MCTWKYKEQSVGLKMKTWHYCQQLVLILIPVFHLSLNTFFSNGIFCQVEYSCLQLYVSNITKCKLEEKEKQGNYPLTQDAMNKVLDITERWLKGFQLNAPPLYTNLLWKISHPLFLHKASNFKISAFLSVLVILSIIFLEFLTYTIIK